MSWGPGGTHMSEDILELKLHQFHHLPPGVCHFSNLCFLHLMGLSLFSCYHWDFLFIELPIHSSIFLLGCLPFPLQLKVFI
jgi:hypothetical protein